MNNFSYALSVLFWIHNNELILALTPLCSNFTLALVQLIKCNSGR